MKKLMTALIGCALGASAAAAGDYDVSEEHPFGQPHPEAADSLSDFAPMIGEWACWSRTPMPEGPFVESILKWEFRYILNGRAIQDIFEAAGIQGLGIRQVNPADGKWNVAYHSMFPNYSNAMWVGEKLDERIVLNRMITQEDGVEVNMRLSFYGIGEDGFQWIGEFVNGEDVNLFWHINCNHRLG